MVTAFLSTPLRGWCWSVLLVFLSGCFSQTSTTKSIVDIQPVEKPFLWQAKKDGKRAWLFGTIHLGIDAERELPKEVWDAFNRSPCFVMESNPAEISMTEIAKIAYLPDGQRLSALLGKAMFARVTEKLKGVMPEALIDRAQPWFVSLLLLRSSQYNAVSMDAVMLARARQSGKTIHYLENWRDALDEYAGVTSLDDLKEMINEEGKLEQDLTALIEAYRTGQEHKLSALLNKVYGQSPAGKEKLGRLIDGRNKKWMPQLVTAIERDGCFVAVGAGHYLGKQSLRMLLDNQGWVIL